MIIIRFSAVNNCTKSMSAWISWIFFSFFIIIVSRKLFNKWLFDKSRTTNSKICIIILFIQKNIVIYFLTYVLQSIECNLILQITKNIIKFFFIIIIFMIWILFHTF